MNSWFLFILWSETQYFYSNCKLSTKSETDIKFTTVELIDVNRQVFFCLKWIGWSEYNTNSNTINKNEASVVFLVFSQWKSIRSDHVTVNAALLTFGTPFTFYSNFSFIRWQKVLELIIFYLNTLTARRTPHIPTIAMPFA